MLHELPRDERERLAQVNEYWHAAESWMDAAEACLAARQVNHPAFLDGSP